MQLNSRPEKDPPLGIFYLAIYVGKPNTNEERRGNTNALHIFDCAGYYGDCDDVNAGDGTRSPSPLAK